VSLPSVKPLAWGTTATQIQQDFALNILYEFETNPNLNALLTNIQPIMLARLSTELKALDSAGHTFWVIVSAAEKVSAANLRLLQSVFGPGPLGWALPYAPPAVQAAYNSLPVRAPLPYSRYAIELGGTALPSVGSMHPYDIFLLQYFCANDIPIVALHKAALYAQVRLKEFWTVLGRILIIVTILDHTEQNWTTELSDWYYLTAHLPYNSPDLNTPFGDTLVLPIPDTTSWPQPIDPEMPFFPPMDFLGDESYCSTDLTEPC
jgi:hypothetical protein